MSKHLRACLAGTALLALPYAANTAAAATSSFVPFTPDTQVHGPAAGDATVSFGVALALRNPAAISAAALAHRILTPAQLDAALPDRAGHQAVLSWLRGQGLTIEATPGSRMSIRVSGPAGLVGRLLGVTFVRVTLDGADAISADREPAIPAALTNRIIGFTGLEPQIHLHSMMRMGPAAGPMPLTTTTGGKPPLYPIDLLTAYGATSPGTTGAGSITAIVINTFPYTADLTRFWATTGVAQSLSNFTFIQVVPGTLAKPGGEESLDAEQSSSMAPGGKVRMYATIDLSNAHLDAAYEAIITDLQAGVAITQMSMSYGGCETSEPAAEKMLDTQYYATMAALGTTVMASSGDSGARECTILPGIIFTGPKVPSYPSSDPNVAAIGGTSLRLTAASAISSETGWSGSGGGISIYFATPSWQQSLGYSHRTNPDVAADADPNTGVYVIYGGKTGQVGGTSVSSPVWAGLMGLVNARRIAAGKSTLGLLASRTTPLLGTGNFRDVTKGSNHGYAAGVGYDLVTGVGSPVMSTLLPTLLAQP